MANKFKYNKTGTETDSIFKGKWAIDTTAPNSGGGPSATTGLYNGAEIPSGGYTIYSPGSVYTATTDEDLIGKVRDLGGDWSSVSAALTWASTDPDIIILNKTFDNIITDGLVLNLDSSDISSYPRNGTVLYDLSGSNNNITLNNGPVFNSNDAIIFDGINDYATSQNTVISGDQTFCASGIINGGPNSPAGIITQHNYASTANLGINHVSGNRFGASIGYTNGTREYSSKNTNYVIQMGVKWHVALVYSSLNNTIYWYVNGELDSTHVLPSIPKSTNWPIGLGRWDPSYNGYYLNGLIYNAQIYNKALTPNEVLHNCIRESNWEIDGDYLKIFRHYSGTGEFFSDNNSWAEAKRSNPRNPQANKYSILDRVSNFLIGNTYTFKLNYPQLGITNIWSQTNNPVTGNGSGGVTDYTAISIGTSSNGWGGLERYDVQTSTFLDGTLSPQSNWYYAIGVKNSWGGSTTFPGPSSAVNEVELWVKYK